MTVGCGPDVFSEKPAGRYSTVRCDADFYFENATPLFFVVLLQAKSYSPVGFGKTPPNRTAPYETKTPLNVLIGWDPRSIASGETDMFTETRTNLNRSSRCQFHEVNDMSPGVGQHNNKLELNIPTTSLFTVRERERSHDGNVRP